MPSNYPPNIKVINEGATFSNMRFNQPVTITFIYNVGFWSWIFRGLILRRPIHSVTMVGCHFLKDGEQAKFNPSIFRTIFRRNKS